MGRHGKLLLRVARGCSLLQRARACGIAADQGGRLREQEGMAMKRVELWPELRLAEWKDTYATLHMWTQIVGKVRLALGPAINHFWGTALYVSARGLTTSAIPYANGVFEIRFDFVA